MKIDEFKQNNILCPDYITKFITSYLKDEKVNNILDPFIFESSILSTIIKKLSPDYSLGLLDTSEALKTTYNTITKIDLKIGNKFELLDNLKLNFDVIVGYLPSNYKKEYLKLESNGNSVELQDKPENLLMLKALQSLKKDGIGIFLLDTGFMTRKGKSKVYSNLESFGFSIIAALELLPESLDNTTSKILIIIKKTPTQPDIFVGELNSKLKNNAKLLKNLKNNKTSKIPELGTIIKRNSFISFKKVFLEKKLHKIANRSNLKSFLISDVSTEINLYNRTKGFDDKTNSVYLPLIGNSSAVNSLENLKIKPQNYIQIVLKNEIVYSEYLSNFFNSDLGMKIRKSIESGIIPKINKRTLSECEIYLPDLETQLQVIKNNSSIRDIMTQLKIEQKNLWKYPQKAVDIKKRLDKVDMKYSVTDWMNSLPFPLASILWTYESEIERTLKFKYLLRFFEAFSQFNFAILLSSLTQNKQYFDEYFKKGIEKVDKKWIFEPDFGSWNYLGSNISAEIRRILEEDDSSTEICLELFGNPNNELLKIITSKQFYQILEEAKRHRNWWEAHDTPAIPKEECVRRMETVYQLVHDLKELTSDVYDNILFFTPIDGKCDSGDCSYKIRELKGPNSHFKKNEIKISPLCGMLDSSDIYFINENQYQPIKMMKFLKISNNAKKVPNALFYNRTEGNELRFVSYHSKIQFEEKISSDKFNLLTTLLTL